MEFDALKSRIFKGTKSIQDIMFACIVDNIFVSWEMHKNKLKENKKKTDTKDQTDMSNIKKIHNLFVESLTDEDRFVLDNLIHQFTWIEMHGRLI